MKLTVLRSHSQGATLVELVVTIMVVSIALAGVLAVIEINARTSADPMVQHQSIAIAEAYLEEILTREFTDPDGLGPETRPNYDNVSDYHGLANNGCTATTAACPTLGSCACDQSGNPIDGLQGYAVNVSVLSEDLVGTAVTLSAAHVWRIQITVTPPLGDPVVIGGYRTNY